MTIGNFGVLLHSNFLFSAMSFEADGSSCDTDFTGFPYSYEEFVPRGGVPRSCDGFVGVLAAVKQSFEGSRKAYHTLNRLLAFREQCCFGTQRIRINNVRFNIGPFDIVDAPSFYRAVIGLSAAVLNDYWDAFRLLYSAYSSKPYIVEDQRDVLLFAAQTGWQYSRLAGDVGKMEYFCYHLARIEAFDDASDQDEESTPPV